jgi:putative iron-regulated protein
MEIPIASIEHPTDRAKRFWLRQTIWGIFALAISIGTNSCSSTSVPSVSTAPAASPVASARNFDKQILIDFADKVVIPTNLLFATRAKELSQAVDLYTKAPSNESLKAAQTAWVRARAAWEQTECFGFGSAKSFGYDGALDTWPVNAVDLSAVVNGKEPLTAASVAKLKETEKGFHVIEYLLFGNNKDRQATSLKPRELQLLKLLGADFGEVAVKLADAWSKGVEGKPAYRDTIATAGDKGNTIYPTVAAGADQIVQGMLDTLDEVSKKKIGETFTKKDQNLAESRFSLNTLTDMKHNIKGAQNVYLGEFAEGKTSGMGLTAFVAKTNPTLDRQIKEKFTVALAAMDKIADPFETAISKPEAAAAIKTAQASIDSVHDSIEKEVKPLIKGS